MSQNRHHFPTTWRVHYHLEGTLAKHGTSAGDDPVQNVRVGATS